jgi:hypothetical protein
MVLHAILIMEGCGAVQSTVMPPSDTSCNFNNHAGFVFKVALNSLLRRCEFKCFLHVLKTNYLI